MWETLEVDAAGSSMGGVPCTSSQNCPGRNVAAQADYIEPQILPDGQKSCGLACTHADWRYHNYGLYAH